MTAEQLLLTAISSVTAALCFVSRALWEKSVQCDNDRTAMHKEIETLKERTGSAEGALSMMERCTRDQCPFRPPIKVA